MVGISKINIMAQKLIVRIYQKNKSSKISLENTVFSEGEVRDYTVQGFFNWI